MQSNLDKLIVFVVGRNAPNHFDWGGIFTTDELAQERCNYLNKTHPDPSRWRVIGMQTDYYTGEYNTMCPDSLHPRFLK